MDFDFTPEQETFRQEARAWLAENVPADLKGRGFASSRADVKEVERLRDWQRTLHKAGYVGMDWPAEYGGRGASIMESIILYEEMSRAGSPQPLNRSGLSMLGPTLMKHGTPAQQARHLDRILTAEDIWCQGFSEPNAGSDLANLQTRAVLDGDHYVLNGQKVWTSMAHVAAWGFFLVRTDPAAAKHKGITFLLIDMKSPGLTIRPLRQITGEAEFNELFIEEARIPDANVVGGVGNGWKVALTTLMNERAGLGFALQIRLRQLLDDLIARAAEQGMLEDALYADALAELHVRCESLRLMAWKGLTDAERYGQPGPEGSLVKWLWSDTNQRLTELAVEIIGPEALTAGTSWSYEFLRARGNTIEGGTTEVLKNIVAERVLGLPRLKVAA